MRSLTLVVLACLALVACRKESDEEPVDRDYTSAVDHDRAESYFNDALKQSDAAAKDGELPCAVSVALDTVSVPHTLLIDFGPSNCTGADGRNRRGRLAITFTGRYRDPGTVITITPEDYYVNDHRLQGVKTVTNAGLNGEGQPFFSVTVNGTVTAPDGSWTSTHSYQRTRTWIAGQNTVELLDDVYMITGSGSGMNRNEVPYSLLITTPLRVEVGCPWIVSGVLQIIPGSLDVRTVDYGSGACDNQVTVSVNGMSFTFGG
jgi:hypothetical protein